MIVWGGYRRERRMEKVYVLKFLFFKVGRREIVFKIEKLI